jgi:hypothetical protein
VPAEDGALLAEAPVIEVSAVEGLWAAVQPPSASARQKPANGTTERRNVRIRMVSELTA